MFGLFGLLFSANYWRTLFHGETWRRSRVALRRAHKDKRARKQLRQLALLLATPFLCVAYVGWLIGNVAGLFGVVIALVLVGLVSLYRNRKPAEKDGPLTLSLQTCEEPKPAPPPEPSPGLRQEFAELALLHAVLVDRAGSENFLRTKVLPKGFEVVTRQRHMEILREYNLYDRLGDAERNLMLLPDGHWPPEMIDHVAMLLEPLRLLRWVLRVDDFLPTVGATMSADFRLAGSIVKDPAPLFRAEKLIEIDPVRIGFTAADHYFYRCWAEGVYRKLFTSDAPEEIARATSYAEQLHGNEGEDMLLGAVIVSKANDADVRLGATLALRRAKILDWVRKRMYGEVPAAERLEAFYLR
jgi:hypothetical protein